MKGKKTDLVHHRDIFLLLLHFSNEKKVHDQTKKLLNDSGLIVLKMYSRFPEPEKKTFKKKQKMNLNSFDQRLGRIESQD